MSRRRLAAVLAEARACTACDAELPHPPRPVLRAAAGARLMIVGQAPGTRVHETGIPWNDRSGDRLRDWLGLDRATFYDERRIAIVPMGFCFPGQDAKGGDLPPLKRCAPLWHPKLRAGLLPRRGAPADLGRHGAGLAQLFARLPAAAPSELAQHRLVEAQPVVRERVGAGAAGAGGGSAGGVGLQPIQVWKAYCL